MIQVTTVPKLLVAATGAVVLSALVPMAAAGAAVPKPSASCKVPVFSVSPLKAKPGTTVTVSGVNFSGCPAQGNPAKPTPVLTVQVGVESASKMSKILATTKTTATGSFSVTVTVPALTTAGVAKLGLAAAAKDSVTGLTYAGVAVLAYDTSTGASSVPTAVPAGSGGQAAAATDTGRNNELALAAAGVLIAGAGGLGLRRSRRKH